MTQREMRWRLRLLIEAAETVVDNFAPETGESYVWDELRASIMLAKRDRREGFDG